MPQGGFTEAEYEPNRSAVGGGITGSGIEEVLVSQVLIIDKQEALRLMRHR